MSITAGADRPSTTPMAMANPIPPTAIEALLASRRGQPMTSEMAIPISGDIRGAMSMAPITTAVESVMTPIEAITDANPMRVKNRMIRSRVRGPS